MSEENRPLNLALDKFALKMRHAPFALVHALSPVCDICDMPRVIEVTSNESVSEWRSGVAKC